MAVRRKTRKWNKIIMIAKNEKGNKISQNGIWGEAPINYSLPS